MIMWNLKADHFVGFLPLLFVLIPFEDQKRSEKPVDIIDPLCGVGSNLLILKNGNGFCGIALKGLELVPMPRNDFIPSLDERERKKLKGAVEKFVKGKYVVAF